MLAHRLEIHAVATIEQESALAFRRQRAQQPLQPLYFLRTCQTSLGRTAVDEFIEYRLRGRTVMDLIASQPIEREVRGRLKQKRAQIADGLRLMQAQQPYISLLRNIPGLLRGAQSGVQESQQSLVVLTEQTLNQLCMRILIGCVCRVGRFRLFIAHVIGETKNPWNFAINARDGFRLQFPPGCSS